MLFVFVKKNKIKMQTKRFKKFLVISTRPYLRTLFFSLKVVAESFLKLEQILTLRLVIISNFGAFVFFIGSQNFINENFFVGNFGLVLNDVFFFEFLKKFRVLIKGIRYAWLVNSAIEGYHFRAFLTKLRKMRKFVVLFHLGFLYNVLVFFPRTIKLYWKKRTFKIRGALLSELIMIAHYIRIIRNLFPYKIKGFVYDSLVHFKVDGYEKALFVIKPGKKGDSKTKTR